MHMKTVASAAILTAALGFSGFAYAQQTMIGDQAITSEADRERVQVYCDDLQNQANQAVGATDAESEASDDDDSSSTDDTSDIPTDSSSDTTTDSDSDDTAEVGSIATDQITLQNCIDAGFISATAE